MPHYGPHALRHACATHLLAQGLSLKEIGDHLGHQSPETTRIYAKVDLAGAASRRGLRPGGPAMNINDLVTHYVTFRRTLGERCKTNESILRSFCRAVGPRTPVGRIRVDAVAAFLAGTGPVTSDLAHQVSRAEGVLPVRGQPRAPEQGPAADGSCPKRPPHFVPYIYSRDELRRLLDAIPSYRRCRTRIEPQTLRAILLLLYGAGLARGEALNLSVADVDLPNALLTIRDTKFFKSRLVPDQPAPDESADRVRPLASG